MYFNDIWDTCEQLRQLPFNAVTIYLFALPKNFYLSSVLTGHHFAMKGIIKDEFWMDTSEKKMHC